MAQFDVFRNPRPGLFPLLLGEAAGSLKSRRAELVRALDLLFTGI